MHCDLRLGRCALALLISVGAGAGAAADTIAVTEFLTRPVEVPASEWVELFNYGAQDVDLTGWTISDEFGDVAMLPEVILPSGGYLILTGNLANFTAEWLPGGDHSFVFELSSEFALFDLVDQVIIRNAQNEVVWNLAYMNDEAIGRATWLTATDFAITNYGTLANPGISRSGDDLGIPGFLGYQQNDFTPDPFAWTTNLGAVGSPLAGGYAVIPGPGGAALFGLLAVVRARRRRGRRIA